MIIEEEYEPQAFNVINIEGSEVNRNAITLEATGSDLLIRIDDGIRKILVRDSVGVMACDSPPIKALTFSTGGIVIF